MNSAQSWAVIGILAAVFGQMMVERWTWMRRVESKLDQVVETVTRLDERLKVVEKKVP